MQEPLVKRIPFAKIVIGLVLVFLLSLGLCGLTLVMAVRGGPSSSHINKLLDPAGMAAIVGIIGSLVALVVTCIAWVVLSIAGGTAAKVSQRPLPLDRPDDTKRNDREES